MFLYVDAHFSCNVDECFLLYIPYLSLNVICKWFCLAVTFPKIQGVEVWPKFNLSKKSPFFSAFLISFSVLVFKCMWTSFYGFWDKGGHRTKGGHCACMQSCLERSSRFLVALTVLKDMKFQKGPNQTSELLKFYFIY